MVQEHVMQEDLDIIAVQETIKQEFTDWELKEMAGNKDFSWIWSTAVGHFGGLAVGVKTEILDIEDSISTKYFICLLLRNKTTNFRFWCINVYGPAKHEFSADFVQELSEFCETAVLPLVMGGDFNLIRNNKERNQGQGDPRLMELFNDFIGKFHLREIFVSGAKFTWSNKQKEPHYGEVGQNPGF